MNERNAGLLFKRRPGRVLFVLSLTALYMFFEAIGGIVSNSLALLADAGHMFADVAALSISLFAFMLSSRPPSHKATFGYYRAEVIAALFNGVVLLMASLFIVKEAIGRLWMPAEINSELMMSVAFGGLVINIIGLWVLHKDKDANLNLRGAWLHVLSDTLGSVGVVISGLLISFFGFTVADPIASIVIALLVSYSSVKLILETLQVLMEHAPSHIDAREVSKAIESLPSVVMLHDLHIWTITSGKDALAVHVVAKTGTNYDELLNHIQKILESKFAISHTTIQIENDCQVKDQTC